ncbi:polysaccharide biosynthesis/export family protein [Methylobacterium organophilum]|uniref:polysaccharide biosynthesis/export family protein n=1 Tax=Methylobacterium organophilum TaxID=410 RepID=UPI001F144469|nr:polysaccharide biosynthesis/export family protein [Methylobacterium organophilum]UMY18610.1 polysaccharide biosynthesis/export family protein [Methylobacterium organophilum]
MSFSMLALPRLSGRIHSAVLMVLLLVAVVSPSWAQDDVYRIAPGDKVTLSVFGQPELAGDYVVGGDGSILLPIVGDVVVADLTLPELQKRVTERLADGYFHQPVVSVRIGEMRPIYVMGDVKTPGSYPYRYGATVQSAIALAGGYALPEQAQIGLRTEFLLAEERVRALELTRRTLLIRRARLEAQLNDAASFALPAGIREDDTVRLLLRSEREVLETQQKALKAEIGLLNEQKPRLEAEILGNKAQTESEQTQLSLIQEHLADYGQLMSNGLARRYTGIELKREEARNKGNIARLASELARLELSIGDLSVRVLDAQNTYKRRVITELQDVRSRLADVETSLPTAREVREARIQQGGTLGIATTQELSRSVSITRRQNGKTEMVRATFTTTLMPGDIVEIRRDGTPAEALAAAGGPGTAVAAAGPTAGPSDPAARRQADGLVSDLTWPGGGARPVKGTP